MNAAHAPLGGEHDRESRRETSGSRFDMTSSRHLAKEYARGHRKEEVRFLRRASPSVSE
jgi:hypothetical protein